MLKILLSLFLLAPIVHAQETPVDLPLRSFVFERKSIGNGQFIATRAETYDYGSILAPAWPSPNGGRGYMLHIMATKRNPGTSVMWAAWSFTSKGLFTTNPEAHVAFMVRSLSTGLSHIGQGVIFGGLAGISQSIGGACTGPVRTQPETWHENPDGTANNRVWGGSFCGPQILDWRKYTVVLHAGASGYAYNITDTVTNQVIYSTYIDNSASPSLVKLEKASGFTTGIVFADTPGTNWKFEVSDIAMGWF